MQELTYDPAKADIVLEKISGGATVKATCREIGLAPGTFFGWIVDGVADLADRYARAQKLQVLAWRDDTVEIADDSSQDYKIDKYGFALHSEHVRRSELRIKQRNYLCEWIEAKHAAKAGDAATTAAPLVLELLAEMAKKLAAPPVNRPPVAADAA